MSVIRIGRVWPQDTELVTLADGWGVCRFVTVCNVTNAGATFRILHSQDKAVPKDDENEALYWDVPVGAQETLHVEWPESIRLDDPHRRRRLRVRSSVAGALVFSAWGETDVAISAR